MGLVGTGHSIGQVSQLRTDWLVNPAPFKARIIENKATHELALENGLACRVFRLSPNAATINLQNLSSGELYLRAIAPEARVKIDGADYQVGGLEGAPIANYIDAAWVNGLHSDPQAYQFAGYTLGATQARFPWKKRLEWMSRDLPWPPPGRQIIMHYVPPSAPPARLGGPVVLEQDFASMPLGSRLDARWKELKAPSFARASFYNEGKVGEVMSANAGSACIEHAWPAGAQSVEVLMDSGEDDSNSWGPGLALVAGGRVMRFITRPGEGKFEADGKVAGTFDRNKPCHLRVRLVNETAIFEASATGSDYATINVEACPQPPSALRMGKVGINGSGTDSGVDKGMVRCHISKVSWRGPEPAVQTAAHANLPEIDVHYELYDGNPALLEVARRSQHYCQGRSA